MSLALAIALTLIVSKAYPFYIWFTIATSKPP